MPRSKEIYYGLTIKELKKEFWTLLLIELQLKTDLFNSVRSPGEETFLSTRAGMSKTIYQFKMGISGRRFFKAELSITGGTQEENKKIFDALKEYENEINRKAGITLIWDRKDNQKSSNISTFLYLDPYDKNNWNEMINFGVDAITKISEACKEPVLKIKERFK